MGCGCRDRQATPAPHDAVPLPAKWQVTDQQGQVVKTDDGKDAFQSLTAARAANRRVGGVIRTVTAPPPAAAEGETAQ